MLKRRRGTGGEGQVLVVQWCCTNWLVLPVCRLVPDLPSKPFLSLSPALGFISHTHLEVPMSISLSFSPQSDAENMQCSAPASALSMMLRSPGLLEVVEGHLGFWPVIQNCPFLLPYSAVLSTQPGEWGRGSSWTMSQT